MILDGFGLRIDFSLEKSMFFIKDYLRDLDFFSIFYCYRVSILNGITVYFAFFFGLSVFFGCYLYTGTSSESFFVLFLPFLPTFTSIYFSMAISSLCLSKTSSSPSSSSSTPYFLFCFSTFFSFLVLDLLF